MGMDTAWCVSCTKACGEVSGDDRLKSIIGLASCFALCPLGLDSDCLVLNFAAEKAWFASRLASQPMYIPYPWRSLLVV